MAWQDKRMMEILTMFARLGGFKIDLEETDKCLIFHNGDAVWREAHDTLKAVWVRTGDEGLRELVLWRNARALARLANEPGYMGGFETVDYEHGYADGWRTGEPISPMLMTEAYKRGRRAGTLERELKQFRDAAR